MTGISDELVVNLLRGMTLTERVRALVRVLAEIDRRRRLGQWASDAEKKRRRYYANKIAAYKESQDAKVTQ